MICLQGGGLPPGLHVGRSTSRGSTPGGGGFCIQEGLPPGDGLHRGGLPTGGGGFG